MTDIIERLAQHYRLVVLRALTERPREEVTRLLILWTLGQLPGGTGSLSVLQEFIEARGHVLTRDQAASACAWLAEQGLVEADLEGDIPGARLTVAGDDLIRGRIVRPGVMPLPTLAWLQGQLGRAHLTGFHRRRHGNTELAGRETPDSAGTEISAATLRDGMASIAAGRRRGRWPRRDRRCAQAEPGRGRAHDRGPPRWRNPSLRELTIGPSS